MNRTVKKICPVTGSDEITVTFPNPEELVMTQRKQPDGKYKRVLRPRKEVKNASLPEVACPNFDPKSLYSQLHKEGKVRCIKMGNVCPIDQIIQDIL